MKKLVKFGSIEKKTLPDIESDAEWDYHYPGASGGYVDGSADVVEAGSRTQGYDARTQGDRENLQSQTLPQRRRIDDGKFQMLVLSELAALKEWLKSKEDGTSMNSSLPRENEEGFIKISKCG